MGKINERIDILNDPTYAKLNEEYHVCHDELTQLRQNLRKLNYRINDLELLYQISHGEYLDMELQVKFTKERIKVLKIRQDVWDKAREIRMEDLYKERSE